MDGLVGCTCSHFSIVVISIGLFCEQKLQECEYSNALSKELARISQDTWRVLTFSDNGTGFSMMQS